MAIQSRKPAMLTRSQTPTHGVGRFFGIRGTYRPVKAPNTSVVTIVMTE
jgi:hypothetical protein